MKCFSKRIVGYQTLLLKFLGLFWILNAFLKGLLDIKCFCSQDDVKPHLPTDDLKLTDKQANVTSVRSRRSSSQVELYFTGPDQKVLSVKDCQIKTIQQSGRTL